MEGQKQSHDHLLLKVIVSVRLSVRAMLDGNDLSCVWVMLGGRLIVDNSAFTITFHVVVCSGLYWSYFHFRV